ncbi:L-2,4-diaminobutyrate decarboxylase [Streptomyces azureus]|uniref:L-2,4-diaminobutyrate decarboxylase n=1 Tax=Streptomyces azureus TaxID=146537 RepID=A0A0K8PEX1_STRAJ|nr:L-2,4-diaminobutyrate decarboxylase [Streptomyces azureus]
MDPATLTAVDAASARVLADGMSGPEPVFLSTLKADREAFTARHPKVTADAEGARILRSVLMKPESELHVERLHDRVEQLTRPRPARPGSPVASGRDV